MFDGMEEAVIEMLAAKQDLLLREKAFKSTSTAEAASQENELLDVAQALQPFRDFLLGFGTAALVG